LTDRSRGEGFETRGFRAGRPAYGLRRPVSHAAVAVVAVAFVTLALSAGAWTGFAGPRGQSPGAHGQVPSAAPPFRPTGGTGADDPSTLSDSTTLYNVTFVTVPSNCSIQFFQGVFGNGQWKDDVAEGSYTITALPCGSDVLTSWTTTAGQLSSNTTSPTTLHVSSN